MLLVKLHVSYPKLTRKIDDAVVEIPGTGTIAEQFRNDPQWRLLPTEWKMRFQRIESRARNYLKNNSLQPRYAAADIGYPVLADINIVPILRAEEIFTQLSAEASQLETVGNEFAEEYETILQTAKEVLGEDVFAAVAHKLPKKTQIQCMSQLSWGVLPITTSANLDKFTELAAQAVEIAQNFEENIRDTETARNVIELANNLHTAVVDASTPQNLGENASNALINLTRQHLSQLAESLASTVFQEPRRVFADSLQHLMNAISGGTTIRDGTLDIVRRACRTLHDFEFVADSALLDALSTVEQGIEGVTPKQLNSNADVGVQLAEVLSAAYKSATNVEAQQTAVRRFRNINVIS